LGTRGRVGVIGIVLGGVFAGRLAACFASASVTYALDTAGGNAVVVACLNGFPLIVLLLSRRAPPVRIKADRASVQNDGAPSRQREVHKATAARCSSRICPI
jgi:hypothetical protein